MNDSRPPIRNRNKVVTIELRGHLFRREIEEVASQHNTGERVRFRCLNVGCKKAKKATTFLSNATAAHISPCTSEDASSTPAVQSQSDQVAGYAAAQQ